MVATLELDEDVLGLVAELSGDPFGPRLGAALNVTVLPMGDQLPLGINIAPAAVTHRSVLMASMRRAFGAFVGARTPGEPASIPASAPGASSYKPAVVRRPVAMFRRPTHRAWRGRTARPRPRRGRR